MKSPTIAATNVSHTFGDGTNRLEVLKRLSIDVRPGELTLIIGPSGSGKSTLLSILSGLLRPSQGDVIVLDQHLWALSPGEIDRFRLAHCGFVFQGFNLFSALTAREQVLLPLQYIGLPYAEASRRAEEALEEVGLAGRRQARPRQLSGGEQQRTAIARAIAKHPRFLFADEPTSALDGKNGQIVIDLLHRIARTHNTTILAVTHDPRLMRHADRILSLEDGVLHADQRHEGPRDAAEES
jgi:putative ABC transport system ATP-binding protein